MTGGFLFVPGILILFGVLSRIGCRESAYPSLVTVISILATTGAWFASRHFIAGNEGLFVFAILLSCFAAGALVAEVLFLIRRKTKKGV